MRRHKWLLLVSILSFYMVLFIATSKHVPCEGNCQILTDYRNALWTPAHRITYVYNVGMCDKDQDLDTLCIIVKDTAGINWNLFADTACQLASQVGIVQPTLFIIRSRISLPADTPVIKNCP